MAQMRNNHGSAGANLAAEVALALQQTLLLNIKKIEAMWMYNDSSDLEERSSEAEEEGVQRIPSKVQFAKGFSQTLEQARQIAMECLERCVHPWRLSSCNLDETRRVRDSYSL